MDLSLWSITAAIHLLGFLDRIVEMLDQIPWIVFFLPFQVWMFWDSLRREKWLWMWAIIFFWIPAVPYYFLVYRPSQNAAPVKEAFEFPWPANRTRIQELEEQIHHLDQAHHHAELGEIYLKQGSLDQACQHLEAARERDAEDLDILALLGTCYWKQERLDKAKQTLEPVIAANARHNYGQTQMTMAQIYAQLGQNDKSIAAWESVLQANTYAQARVLLGEAYLAAGRQKEARAQFKEVLRDDKHTPDFHRRRDKPWIKRARQMLAQFTE